ncbi:MAG: citrate/2-methylcitrate synthase [Candidatus Hodarchaeales archaeon]|jgi:citrate synthase
MTTGQNPRNSILRDLSDPDIDIKGTGLRGIEVADSSICLIEGGEGKLFYRGYTIEDLASNSTYEEVVFLLIHGDLPDATQLEEFSSNLAANRELPKEIIEHLQRTPKTASSMNVLQAAVAQLASFDPELEDDSKTANYRKAIRIIASIPTIVAAWERIRNNKAAIAPDNTLIHAANFLYMLTGNKPESNIARVFDAALILHAEHSFNASTFTARVIASTAADIYTSISGAIGSLSGQLHGGANSAVMRNLLEIGDISKAEAWVRNQFEAGKRIMGMGHAVYRTMDPRAKILKEMAKGFIHERTDETSKFFHITNKIVEVTQEEFMKRKGRQIFPNIDLYSPSVYSAMGIPMEAFTPIFSLSRSAGWAAHVIEEKFPEVLDGKPAIYRPSADYVGLYCGPLGCEFIPVQQRDTESVDEDLIRHLVVQELQKVQSEPLKPESSTYATQDTAISGKSIPDAIPQIADIVLQRLGEKPPSAQSKPTLEKDLITESEIQDLNRNGIKELYLAAGAIITPLARDRAKEFGIKIIFR